MSGNDSTSLPAPSPETDARRPVFVTTHWSMVLAARDKSTANSEQALGALCRAYWFPLYAFARRQGRSQHDAQDLTQEFFARLMAKDYLRSVDRERGRFRSFLLVAFKRFLADAWDRQHAQKRGGFTTVLSIDEEMAESRFALEPGHQLQPDLLFDRQWALTLLERTMKQLESEYVASGRAKLFELLQNCLAGDESSLPYAQIAARLNLTEASVKMAAHRLRARYREILRAEIANTVSSADEVEEEIRHLFASFKR